MPPESRGTGSFPGVFCPAAGTLDGASLLGLREQLFRARWQGGWMSCWGPGWVRLGDCQWYIWRWSPAHLNTLVGTSLGFPAGSDGKESACNAEDLGSIPGLGRSHGGGHGNPLQFSCLENPMDRGAWWATNHGVAQSWTRLSD